MKKFLIALFTIFACSKTFAEPVSGFIPPIPPIYAHPDVVEYAIKKYVVAPYDPNKVTAAYEQYMNQNDGTITLENLQQKVCPAGGMDKTRCKEFTDALMIYYYDVCDSGKGKSGGNEHCVENFWATIHGTWVRLSEAIGIAQEYAHLKNKKDVVCSPKTRQVNPPARASYLKCTSVDGENYYEFKFNSTTETKDRDIISGTLRAVGKMHNIEFQNSDCTLERIASDSNCALAYKTSDIGQCEKINKSLKRFGYSSKIITTEKFGKRCEVFGITGGNRSAYGIDNTVFQDVQYVAGPEVENRIKAYVQKELSQQNIKLEKFSCDKTTKHDYTNVAMDGLVKKHSEILTCYVNGSPIDFLFADLSESGKRAKEAGLSKMACAQIGGKIDGRDCRGLDEMECTKVSHKIPGGTTWDEKAEVCILNKADIEKKTKDRIQILGGLVLAVGISAAIVPGLALSATGETAYILLSGVGSVIVDQGFIQIERLEELKPAKYAYEFVTDAIACDIPADTTKCDQTEISCATDVVSKHFGRLDEIIDKLNNSQLTSVVEAMVNVTDCLSDEQFRTALNTITPSTNLKDKVANQAGLFWLLAGMFVSPENTVTKLASRAPKIARVLSRCHVVERVSGSLDGAKYIRIYVDNLDSDEIKRLVSAFEKRGIKVSSNIEDITNKRFIGVADMDVFNNWRTSSSNWLLNNFDINTLKNKASSNFDKYLNDFLQTGSSAGLPASRLSKSEWDKLNEFLKPQGVQLTARDNGYMYFTRIGAELSDFASLRNKASQNFDKYLNDFLQTGSSAGLPASRLNKSEWDELNNLLKAQNVQLRENGGYMYFTRIGYNKNNVNNVNNVSESSIFSKVYNDYLPDDVMEAKLKYVHENSSTRESAIKALKDVGIYNATKTTQLANDLADEAIRRIRQNPELIDQMRRYRSLNNNQREKLMGDLHEIITTERRNHVGNTQIFYDFNTSWSGKKGHGTPNSGFIFTYGMQLDSVEDMIKIAFHENTHALQELGKSALPKPFAEWNLSHYLGSQSQLYYDNVIEIEAYAIGDQAARRVVQALGLY